VRTVIQPRHHPADTQDMDEGNEGPTLGGIMLSIGLGILSASILLAAF
jgi:hypothetical protein